MSIRIKRRNRRRRNFEKPAENCIGHYKKYVMSLRLGQETRGDIPGETFYTYRVYGPRTVKDWDISQYHMNESGT